MYKYWVVLVLVSLLSPLIFGATTDDPHNYSVLTANCTCVQARAYYHMRRIDTTAYDAVFHYDQWAKDGSWNCDLCREDPIYMTDPRVRCDAAIQKFVSLHPDVTAETAFDYYWQNFMGVQPLVWPYEMCTGVLPKSANPPPFAAAGINSECTCLAARLDYLNRYPLVASNNFDPVNHYMTYYASNPEYTWNCNLCSSAPVYLTSSHCRACTPALNQLKSAYPIVNNSLDPFLFYWDFYWVIPHLTYHCELCPVLPEPNYQNILANCTCVQARAEYHLKRNDTVIYDAVAVFNAWTYPDGGWNCDLCKNDPIYMDDPRVRCDAAKQSYAMSYDVEVEEAFAHYYTNFLTAPGFALHWPYQMCPEALPKAANQPPIATVGLTRECTCLEARLDYLKRYPAVKANSFDPLYHYVRYHNEDPSYTWNCNLCNSTTVYLDDIHCQTCAPAIERFTSLHPFMPNAYNPFLFYNDFYWVYPFLEWKCELCPYDPATTGSGTTTGAVTTTTGSSTTGGSNTEHPVSASCQCQAARMHYWRANPDVAHALIEPVYHYQSSDGYTRGDWGSRYCRSGVVYFCTTMPTNYQSSVCSSCPSAAARYVSEYPAAATYTGGAYKHFIDNYPNSPAIWHCENCFPQCNCWQARAEFLAFNGDVDTNNYDALYHYHAYGKGEGRVWPSCDFCPNNNYTVWMNSTSSLCNCHAAAQNYTISNAYYLNQITNATMRQYYMANPFQHWMDFHMMIGVNWRCELCSIPQPPPTPAPTLTPGHNFVHIEPGCNCVAARVWYYLKYDDVAKALMDPSMHYDAFGSSETEGRAWNCDYCKVDPVFMDDPIVRCQAAVTDYRIRVPIAATKPNEVYAYYWSHFNSDHQTWRAEMCADTLTDLGRGIPADIDEVCTCMGARLAYTRKYPESGNVDPLHHYTKNPTNEWDCSICTGDLNPLYISDDWSRKCNAAVVAFSANHSRFDEIKDPFLAYWNYYLELGMKWNSVSCMPSTPTTGGTGVSTTTTTTTGGSNENCYYDDVANRCLAAANYYLVMNADVLAENTDPFYHYQNFPQARTWKCDLCAASLKPKYQDASTCNCTAAVNHFLAHNDYDADGFGMPPFEYWQSLPVKNYRWRCELCPNMFATHLDKTCDCIASRAAYRHKYGAEVEKFDEVYHYQMFGYHKGYEWACGRCAYKPHDIEESVTDCPQARQNFLTTLTIDSRNPTCFNNGRQNCWLPYHATLGHPWRYDLCAVNSSHPHTTPTCNCTDARALYNSQNTVSGDPWTHYISTGRAQGLQWDCGICNDTCPGVLASNQLVYQEQKFSSFSQITVPRGCYVPLSSKVDITANNFYVNGTLRCLEGPSIAITASKFLVYGNLECGTATSPFAGSLSLEITQGNVNTPIEQGGDKSVAVFSGGRLVLHGKKETTWVSLAATARVGDTTIQVSGTTGWEVNDTIVITSTSFYSANSENEVRTITAINGATITLNSALTYNHEGVDHELTVEAGRTLVLKKRAEVGLLSNRNIRIAPSLNSQSSGVHIIVLNGGSAYVSGIQISYGGQTSVSGAHPVNFYNLGNTQGQYFKSSSIFNSFNLGVVITRSNNITIANNFVFNSTGSAYSLATGTETVNTFDANLGVATRASPSSSVAGPYAYEPATYLITNTNNRVTNNVAVAGTGTGFWFKPSVQSTWGTVKNNLAHSVVQGFSTCSTNGYTGSNNTATLDGLQVYGAQLGLWACGAPSNVLSSVFAESSVGYAGTSANDFKYSAWVGYFNSHLSNGSVAISLLESGFTLESCLFKNFDASSHSIFRPVTSKAFNPNTSVSKITKSNANIWYSDPSNITFHKGYSSEWSHFVVDVDGSLTDNIVGAPATLVTSHPLMISSQCVAAPSPATFGYVCPSTRFTEIRVQMDAPGLAVAAISRVSQGKKRALDTTNPSGITFPAPGEISYGWQVVVNSPDHYIFTMPVSSRRIASLSLPAYAQQGDSVYIVIKNVNYASAFSGSPSAISCADVSSGAIQRYYYDAENNQLCVRLVATEQRQTGSTIGYGSQTFYSSVVAGNSTVGQPDAINTNGPYDLPHRCTCINAMVKYWEDNNVSTIDAVHHYQTVGYSSHSWPCEYCDDEPHYVTESYCDCAAARSLYNETFPEVAKTFPNLYEHYLLYRFVIGNAYHCELCTIPVENNDNLPEEMSFVNYNTGVAAGLGALVGVAVLLSVFAATMLWFYWAAFNKHGSFYCAVIVTGTLVAYVGAFVLLPKQTDGLCVAFPWFLGIGFTLTYGCLFIKTWALFKAWHAATQYKKSSVTPATILRGIGIAITVEIILLVIWTAVDPPKLRMKKMFDDKYQGQCESDTPIFWIIFCAVKGVWMIFGAVLSVLTRNVAHEYSESKSIAYAIYNNLLLGVLAVPLALTLRNIPPGSLIIQVGVIVVAFAFTTFILFFDIWHEIFFPQLDLASKMQSGVNANSATTRSGSGSVSGGSGSGKYSSGSAVSGSVRSASVSGSGSGSGSGSASASLSSSA